MNTNAVHEEAREALTARWGSPQVVGGVLRWAFTDAHVDLIAWQVYGWVELAAFREAPFAQSSWWLSQPPAAFVERFGQQDVVPVDRAAGEALAWLRSAESRAHAA